MFRVMQAHLSDLTMSPLRFARGQALSTVKGLARWAARSFAALRMTKPLAVILSAAKDLSRTYR